MDAQAPPLSQEEAEELAQLLAAIEGGPENPDVPQNIQELLRNVKRRKGDKSDDQQGEEVVPEPGFVVKTTDQQKRKVFLNICGSPKVEAPAGVSNGQLPEELLQALDRMETGGQKLSEQDMESLRIPLSCGNPREDKDNKGDACTTVDVVYNLDIIKQAAVARALKFFIIQIAMNWVAQKFGTQLDPKYKLPKMRYKGERVRPQFMRTAKKPLVKDMGEVPEDPVFPLLTKKLLPKPAAAAQPGSSSEQQQQQQQQQQPVQQQAAPAGGQASRPSAAPAKPAGATQQQSAGAAAAAAPAKGNHKLEPHISFSGKPVEVMTVTVKLPGYPRDQDKQGINVECLPQQLTVTVSSCSTLQVTLPFAAAASQSTALVEEGTLKVQLPVRPLREVVEELRRTAPHMPGSIQLASTAAFELD